MDREMRERILEERLRGVTAVSKVKDDVICKKLDKILENQEIQQQNIECQMSELRENQQKLEQRMDDVLKRMETLRGEISQKRGERCGDLAKFDAILDTVQTNLGYLEYFSLKEETFEKTMADPMSKSFKNLEANSQQISHMDRKVDQFSRKMDDYGSKLTILKAELEGNWKIVPRILKEMKDQRLAMERIAESQKVEFEEIKVELDTTLAQNSDNSRDEKEIAYRCFNSNCHSVFPKDFELREDGVSVQCPNVECRGVNIVGKLKEGHKWMKTICNGQPHLQQCPLDIKHGTNVKCQVCGEERTFYDKCDVVVDSRNIKAKEIRIESKGSPTYKCFNFNCNYIFPDKPELNEDGVSILCQNQKCRYINIVGQLKKQHRWMAMSCNGKWHYQQFPLQKNIGEMTICQVCGTKGETRGERDSTAVCI